MRQLIPLLLMLVVQGEYNQPAPECGLDYGLGALTRKDNADGTKTFSQAGVRTYCVAAPPHPRAACDFCFAFQLLKQYKSTNIWEVIPPYPAAQQPHVACDDGATRTLTSTTPALAAGHYEMSASLWGGPCEFKPVGVPIDTETNTFTVK